jgi:hypothetical protein
MNNKKTLGRVKTAGGLLCRSYIGVLGSVLSELSAYLTLNVVELYT